MHRLLRTFGESRLGSYLSKPIKWASFRGRRFQQVSAVQTGTTGLKEQLGLETQKDVDRYLLNISKQMNATQGKGSMPRSPQEPQSPDSCGESMRRDTSSEAQKEIAKKPLPAPLPRRSTDRPPEIPEPSKQRTLTRNQATEATAFRDDAAASKPRVLLSKRPAAATSTS